MSSRIFHILAFLGRMAGALESLLYAIVGAVLARLLGAIAWWYMPRERTVDTRMSLIAHRGASAILPENTIRGALGALDAGADGVEYDLQLLADGTLVVLHDETLRRTVRQGEGSTRLASPTLLDTPVSQLYFSQLEHVDVGGETLPTFERMLATLLARDSTRLSFVELKRGSEELLVSEALNVCRKLRATPDSIVFISFGADVCARIKRAAPQFRVLILGACVRESETRRLIKQALSLGLDGINVNAHPNVLTPSVVRNAHAAGLLVATWVYRAPGANDREFLWEFMRRAGVDFFTTNLPPEICAWADRSNGGRRLQKAAT